MPEPATNNAPERYLIHSQEPSLPPALLRQLGSAVERVIGPPQAPHTAVAHLRRDQADALARQYPNLTFEPDQPLSLFSLMLASGGPVTPKGSTMAKNPESAHGAAPESVPPQKPNGTPVASSAGSEGAEAREARDPRSSSASSGSTGTSTGSRGRNVGQRKSQFLIASRRAPALQALGLQPLQFSVIEQTLRSSPDIEVVDTVGPKNIMGALADGMGEVPSVLVARMNDQKAAMLHQQSQGRLIIERDHHLSICDPAMPMPWMVNAMSRNSGPSMDVTITVVGKDGAPVPEAEVYLFGSLLPTQGQTDQSGQVKLTLYGETPQSIHALYVKPRADHWSLHQLHPDLSTDEANVVALRPLSEWPALNNFPKQQMYGWGQKAMRLDQLPSNYRGQGVKVAVIDSGAATSHDDLKQIHFGFDVINKKNNPHGWNEDSIAHGSHCAGIIAGADNPTGVRGFAPDAEVHVCKLFPGGQISQLIDALEYCIEKQIDVVNLSLGGAEPSEALEQQIQRAKRAGVACIVAAGNSAGPVQYPASSPHVLAVAAIGKINEFPADSYHTQTVTQNIDAQGFFAARFSCYGPQVAVCAPGVAIPSTVPQNNYAVWDGTSMAAPHVTGLAALVLAHHPEFQTAMKVRSAERVERLFQIIRMSARPVLPGSLLRTGFGLPDVLVALGLQPRMQAFGMTQPVAAMLPEAAAMFEPAYAGAAQMIPQMLGLASRLGQNYGRVGW